MEVIGGNGVPDCVASKVSPAEVKPGEYYVVSVCSFVYSAICSFVVPVRKENEVALQWAEMRMVRCICGIKRQDGVPSKRLRETRIT